MLTDLIGRLKEAATLNEVLNSKSPELVAVYGRRRIGKTYLIRSVIKSHADAKIVEVMGNKSASTNIQLENFSITFSACFHQCAELKIPKSWRQAFATYTQVVEKNVNLNILFLDELPWLAKPRSGLISAIDYFWNKHWCRLPNLKVILCGSAASWMLDKLVHSKGGLHNRLTKIIALKPFSLAECKKYLLAREVKMSEKQILDLVLCTGGVPYYLNSVRQGISAAQAIQELCFNSSGVLYKEYDSLLPALFSNSSMHEKIIQTLSSAHYGLTRSELIKRSKIKDSGTFSRALKELVQSNFLGFYTPFSKGHKAGYYRVIDPFILFHTRWIAPIKASGVEPLPDYWLKASNTQKAYGFFGYNFENICLAHIPEIIKKLGISGMLVKPSSWQAQNSQVELVLDRADRIINLCEIKNPISSLRINQKLLTEIRNKIGIFIETTATKRSVVPVLISSGEILGSEAFKGELAGCVEGKDLFEEA
jgi:hypothetical protein